MPSSLALAALLVALPFVATAGAWQVRVGSSVRHGGVVATDARGDVVSSTERRVGGHRVPQIVKLAARGGRLVWRRTFRDAVDGWVNRLALTAGGDVIAAGALGPDRNTISIARLAGTDGSIIWRHALPAPPQDDALTGVVLDGAGDVIAAGDLDGQMVVRKLDGADGHELWRADVGPGSANDVLVDDAGNAIVVGGGEAFAAAGSEVWTRVVMLDGATGARGWAREMPMVRSGPGLSVGNGAVAVAAQGTDGLYGAFVVLLLDAVSGETRWERRLGPATGGPSDPKATATAFLSPDGDIVAAGTIDDMLVTVRLDRATGDVLWRHDVTGDHGAAGGVLTVAPTGDLLLGGAVFDQDTCWDVAIVAIAAATGDRLSMRQLHGRAKDRSACASGGADDGLGGVAASPLGVVAVAATLADPRASRRLIGTYPLLP